MNAELLKDALVALHRAGEQNMKAHPSQRGWNQANAEFYAALTEAKVVIDAAKHGLPQVPGSRLAGLKAKMQLKLDCMRFAREDAAKAFDFSTIGKAPALPQTLDELKEVVMHYAAQGANTAFCHLSVNGNLNG